MKKLPLIFAALALASCGEPIKPWSMSYREASTTRIYTNTSPAQAITAAESVLRLTATPRQVSIKPTADGFIGDRYFTGLRGMQFISGDYRFTLSAKAQGKNTEGEAADRQSQSVRWPGECDRFPRSGRGSGGRSLYALFRADGVSAGPAQGLGQLPRGGLAAWPSCRAAADLRLCRRSRASGEIGQRVARARGGKFRPVTRDCP